MELIKLAREISKISSIQNADFKHSCIAIYNKRWNEFDIDIYMLAFFLNPKYRGMYNNPFIFKHLFNNIYNSLFLHIGSCFQYNIFRNISKTALNIWKNQGGGRTSSDILLMQLSLYRNFEEPFDEIYVDGINTPINWWTSLELKKGEDHIRMLALKLHSIVPHNGACERVFSILGWYLGKRRTK